MDAVRFLVTEAKADPHQRNQVGKAYIHRVRAFIIDNSDNSEISPPLKSCFSSVLHPGVAKIWLDLVVRF